jgi:hypothetical protein
MDRVLEVIKNRNHSIVLVFVVLRFERLPKQIMIGDLDRALTFFDDDSFDDSLDSKESLTTSDGRKS